jgi:predicted AlkP superfamily pyrophosphatase or phosphodiesterase
MTRRLAFLVAVALVVVATPAGPSAQTRDPIVVLVSFDGWRWDYIDRANVPHLKALAARGVRAKAMIPSFPSLTFPNHYTLVTGLYPSHHGIVANNFVEPGFPLRFGMSAETARDPRWWGGEPIWVTAIRQGRRAMNMFWPGSEVEIRGVRPTAFVPYDGNLPNADRVAQALAWLALPEDRRPSFVSLYFSDVDHVGHVAGPESREILEAAAALDATLGQLVEGIGRLGLADRTTVLVVSDHGMSQLSYDRMIYLDDALDLSAVEITEEHGSLGIRPRTMSVDALYQHLRGRYPPLTVYKRQDLPPSLHYAGNPRIPPIVGTLQDGWFLTTYEREARATELHFGAHGFPPTYTSMGALFVAAGPRVRENLLVEPFENIHVYEFMCRLLNLKPAQNDGKPGVTRGFFR